MYITISEIHTKAKLTLLSSVIYRYIIISKNALISEIESLLIEEYFSINAFPAWPQIFVSRAGSNILSIEIREVER